jgi:hypothetical protein
MAKRDVIEMDPQRKSEPTSRQPYEDVDKLRSSDDLVAIISQRRANGEFTFGIFKEFERPGPDGEMRVERSGFVPERLGASYVRMVGLALDRIREIKASGKHPFPIRD